MNSRLYSCQVMHARFSPKRHRFSYGIFMFALDLDELGALDRGLRWFSVGRANLYRFDEGDYLPTHETPHNAGEVGEKLGGRGRTLKQRVLDLLVEHGVEPGPGAKVELVTLPRVLGYLFNPVSFYFCRNAAGECVATIAEVTNTFREMKAYVLGPECREKEEAGDGDKLVFRARVPKYFYVSPFSDVDVAFDFALRPAGDRMAMQIDDYEGSQRTLTSVLTGKAEALTDVRLAGLTVRHPLLTLKVISLIHWHALRLWLKKTPWFAKAARGADQRKLYRPHVSLEPARPAGVRPTIPVI